MEQSLNNQTTPSKLSILISKVNWGLFIKKYYLAFIKYHTLFWYTENRIIFSTSDLCSFWYTLSTHPSINLTDTKNKARKEQLGHSTKIFYKGENFILVKIPKMVVSHLWNAEFSCLGIIYKYFLSILRHIHLVYVHLIAMYSDGATRRQQHTMNQN